MEAICTMINAALMLCSVEVSIPVGGHEVVRLPPGLEKVCRLGWEVTETETPVGLVAQTHRTDCGAVVGVYNVAFGEKATKGEVLIEISLPAGK